MKEEFIEKFYDEIVVNVEKDRESKAVTRNEETGLILLFTAYNSVIFAMYLLLFWGKEINELMKHF